MPQDGTIRFSGAARRGTVAGLGALVAGSLAVRALPAWANVFRGGTVRFAGTDAWYYARLAAYRVANFPHGLVHDPYLAHPGGSGVPAAPLFDFALASAAWIAGFGHPSPRLVGIVTAAVPALLGALVVLPVFLLARRLWGTAAGWVAALLIAVLPGQFLARSLLGYADHHVAESLLALLCVSALMRAEPERPLRSSAEAGAWLGLYLLTWQGGALLVLVLVTWVFVQGIADALGRRVSGAPAAALGAFLVAGAVVVPFFDGVRVPSRHLVALAGGIAVAAALLGVARLRAALGLSAGLGLATLIGLSSVALFAGALAFPGVLSDVRLNLARLWPAGGGATVGEMVPLLEAGPAWLNVWREYTTAGAAAAAGLALLLVRAIRRGEPPDVLFAVWCVWALVLALGQRRFSYYFAVNVALLSGLAVSAAAEWLLGTRGRGPSEPERAGRRAAARPLVIGGLALALAGPSLRASLVQAKRDLGPSGSWVETLERLRRATPEPFGSEEAWLAPPGTLLPASRYGVMAWWDEGYWIIDIARRVPIANPTQRGASVASSFFLSQDEDTASRILERAGAPYVLVDEALVSRAAPANTVRFGKLGALAAWAGEPAERYVRLLQTRGADGAWNEVVVFTPKYFRAMVVRLRTFPRGSTAAPERAWVFGRERPDSPRIDRLFEFRSAREAEDFLRGRPAEGLELGSPDPGASCVALEPLRSFDELSDVTTVGVRAYRHRAPGESNAPSGR